MKLKIAASISRQVCAPINFYMHSFIFLLVTNARVLALICVGAYDARNTSMMQLIVLLAVWHLLFPPLFKASLCPCVPSCVSMYSYSLHCIFMSRQLQFRTSMKLQKVLGGELVCNSNCVVSHLDDYDHGALALIE